MCLSSFLVEWSSYSQFQPSPPSAAVAADNDDDDDEAEVTWPHDVIALTNHAPIKSSGGKARFNNVDPS